MDAVEASDEGKREAFIDVGRTVLVNVNIGAEIRNTPAPLLRMRRKAAEQQKDGQEARNSQYALVCFIKTRAYFIRAHAKT
jgi:hypothetical protein